MLLKLLGRRLNGLRNVFCFYLIEVAVAVAITASDSSAAAVLLDDTWTDGSRYEQNLPFQSAWFAGGAGTNWSLTAATNSMTLTLNTNGNAVLGITYFTDGTTNPLRLAIGDKLTAALNMTLDGVCPTNTTRGFRLGIFNFGDSTLSPKRVTGDGFSNSSQGDGVQGYALFQTISPQFLNSSPTQIQKRTDMTNTALLSLTAAYTSLTFGPGNTNGFPGFSNNIPYTLFFVLQRLGTNSMAVSIIWSNTANSATLATSFTDTSATNFSFDGIAWRPQAANLSSTNIIFQEVKVTLDGPTITRILFTNDFDGYASPVVVTNSGTTSGYNILFSAASGPEDFTAIFGFDYSTVTYPTTITSAPNSGGTTKGIYLAVNKDITGVAAAVNLYPVGASFSGNFSLKFDAWLNYGFLGSTEHVLFGINHSGTTTNQVGKAGSDGLFFGVDGDGGILAATTTIKDFTVLQGRGTNTPLVMTTNNSTFGPAPLLGEQFDNTDSGFATLFPARFISGYGNTQTGSVGFAWVSCEVRQQDKTITWLLNDTIVAQYTNTTAYTNGDILIGYNDFFNSIGESNNFAIIDNVRVIALDPTISSQPAGGAISAGSGKTFNVIAYGLPTLTYQWRKNGANIAGATNSSYVISVALAGDGGSYDVVVANSFGSVTSSVAILDVICPSITVSPTSLPGAAVGGTYSQTITASGGTSPYTFSVTSGSLPGGLSLSGAGALTGTLTVGGVYTFTVTATDANDCTGSRNYSVAVTVDLTNTIHAGYNLIANQLDQGANTLNEIMPSVPDGCFLFKYDNIVGSYIVSFYNSSIAAWLPGNIFLNPGEGAFLYAPTNFDLVFTGVPHTPVLPLTVCSGYRLLSRQTNAVGTFDNIIGAAPVGGEVVYKWTGSNYSAFTFDGVVWSPATPTVAVSEAVWIYTPSGPSCHASSNSLTAPPVITTQPQSQTVAVGTNVTFTVVASGGGTLTYQWRLNGVNISGATTSSLSLTNVQPVNSGDYTVVVANEGGATESKVAKLLLTIADGGFADNFANRVTTNSSAGSATGNNLNATKELGEPNHAGNPGGKSVWYAWQAPANGIVAFDTKGSSFDTVLAVYTGTNVANLHVVASDDDSGGFFAGQVTFNVQSGVVYSIAMDGAYGASGNIVLSWNFTATADVVPQITTQPQDQVSPEGSNLTLSVVATVSGGPLTYQWFFNDASILNATNSSYTIPNVDVTKIGLYKVRVSSATRNIFSTEALVQIATVEVGKSEAPPAQDKFLDTVIGSGSSSFTGFRGGKPKSLASAAPAAGFTGTQIFNTYGSSKEPGEPNHCGEPGGASYWFSYQAPANGHLYIDTSNSAFNTVLAVYTGPLTITSFTNLTSKACANVAGLGGEVVDFDATNGMMYYIAVDGVGAAKGLADLHYSLVTAPPVIATPPQTRSVHAGSNVTLAVSMAASSTPLGYQWQFFSTNLPGAASSFYTRSGFQVSHQGNYRVIVTNMAGSVTGGPAMLYLDTPAICATNLCINSTGYFQAQWAGPTNSMLVLQMSTNLTTTNWISIKTNTLTGVGTTTFTDVSPATPTNRAYRVRLMFP